MLLVKKIDTGVRITGGVFAPGDPPLRVVELNEGEVRAITRDTIKHRTRDANIERGFMRCACIGCQIYYKIKGV